MNKKLLHKNIMESLSKTLGKTLNEGAGAGYDVTIKGLTATNIEVLGKETKGKDEIVKFHAELVPGQVEWEAQDYYDGFDSTGIFYDGMQVDEIDDEQRHIDGGEIYGYVYLQDVGDYDNGYGDSEEEEVTNYIEEHLNDFEFKTMYGSGWSHIDLDDPMEFEDIEVSYQNRGYECVFIDKIIINAPEITAVINWFFENKDNFEEIYGLTDDEDLDESVKIKTKKKSVTEDLTKSDKEDAESKMDKWHEGKRKQNVKACSTDKLIMNLGICKRKGYDAEAQQLQDELDSRGINESAEDRSGNIILNKYLGKYEIHNAYELVQLLENDGWELDENYVNWGAGEYATIRLIRNSEKLWITYRDRNDRFDSSDIRGSLPYLHLIIDSEYVNKKAHLAESQLFEDETVERTFEPEFDEVIEHVKNGTVDAEKDSEILFDALVPGSGHADSLGGKLLRAAKRIAYRYYNDGDRAGEGYGRETVNPVVRFMKENVPTTSPLYGIVRDFYRFIDYGCNVDDKEYEFMVMQLLKLTVIHIIKNRLWEVPNHEDMYDYKDPDVDVDRDDWEDEDWDDEDW